MCRQHDGRLLTFISTTLLLSLVSCILSLSLSKIDSASARVRRACVRIRRGRPADQVSREFMFSRQHTMRLTSAGLALLLLPLAPAWSQAETIVLRNDSQTPVQVH